MNGHNRRCQCTSCDTERIFNNLTERVANLEQQVRDNGCTISALKSVNDEAYFKTRAPAYQPVRIDYDLMEVVPEVVWEKEVPAPTINNQPMETMKMYDCRWRTVEPRKLKADQPVTFQNDEDPDAQPIVIGGES